jgi:hypothetical protein
MDNTSSELKFERRYVGSLLKNGNLRVPPNQRDYAWKPGNVDDLCSDLHLAISRGAREYFLGTIVVIPEQKNLMVVDGQQRLATSKILLAAIRDYYIDVGDKDGASMFTSKWLYATHPLTKQRDVHLVLNETDSTYFLERVLLPKDDPERKNREKADITKPSHKLIDKAAKRAEFHLKKFLENIPPAAHLEYLEKWVEFLENFAAVIFVTAPTEGSAYMIFETMNDRGLELSAIDLIKNYMLGKAGDNFSVVKKNWTAMLGNLDSMSEDEKVKNFVRHYWISKKGIVRTQELFNSLKTANQSPSQVLSLSDQLQTASTRYAALVNPSSPIWNQYPLSARESLEALKTLGISQTRPLLLAALEHLPIEENAKLLTSLESWAVRLIAAGTLGTGALEQVFAKIAVGISERKLKSAKGVESQIKKDIPENPQFIADFSAMKVGNHKIARYFLRSLEIEGKPYLDASKDEQITLEHVMPENHSKDWKNISEEIHDEYVSRLGNLALLKDIDNSTFKDKGFSVKKPILAGVPLKLTSMIGLCADWDEKEIQKRQQYLASLAINVWPREGNK